MAVLELTLWVGVAVTSAFADLAAGNGVQLSAIPGQLMVVASLLLRLAGQQEGTTQRAAPILKLLAIAVALTGSF